MEVKKGRGEGHMPEAGRCALVEIPLTVQERSFRLTAWRQPPPPRALPSMSTRPLALLVLPVRARAAAQGPIPGPATGHRGQSSPRQEFNTFR